MPQVLNTRHLPGFKERQPLIPPDAVTIGRTVRWYRLLRSKWANPFTVKRETDHETALAAYERWLRLQRPLMGALHELCGLDLVCWCAPLPCHGDLLLRRPCTRRGRSSVPRPWQERQHDAHRDEHREAEGSLQCPEAQS